MCRDHGTKSIGKMKRAPDFESSLKYEFQIALSFFAGETGIQMLRRHSDVFLGFFEIVDLFKKYLESAAPLRI